MVRPLGNVNVADIREMVAPMGEVLTEHHSQPRLLDLLDAAESAVYEALPSRGSRDTGDLALRAGLSLPDTLIALSGLRTRGLIALPGRPVRGAGPPCSLAGYLRAFGAGNN